MKFSFGRDELWYRLLHQVAGIAVFFLSAMVLTFQTVNVRVQQQSTRREVEQRFSLADPLGSQYSELVVLMFSSHWSLSDGMNGLYTAINQRTVRSLWFKGQSSFGPFIVQWYNCLPPLIFPIHVFGQTPVNCFKLLEVVSVVIQETQHQIKYSRG